MSKKISHIALMGNSLRPIAGLDSIYGYDIVANDNIRALIRYGEFEKITCIQEAMQYQETMIRRMVRSLSKSNSINTSIDFVSEFRLANGQEDPEIDILHNVGSEFVPHLYFREMISKRSFPITYTIHGASYPQYIENFYLMKLLLPFRSYDSLICTSISVKRAVQYMLDSISESLYAAGQAQLRYTGRLDVLPLGIDTSFFKPIDQAKARSQFGFDKDAFIMLWIGRFSAYDKADLFPLLTVLKRLIQKNPRIKPMLVLAGYDHISVPILPRLHQYIAQMKLESHVVLLEQHNLAERNRLMACADVFLSPADNIQETFGLTPIEAMACGVPQVVSDWDGYRDTVKHEETGFLIPTYWAKCDDDIAELGLFPSDVNRRSALHHLLLAQSVAVDLVAMEEAIQKLIDFPNLRKKMSQFSVDRARKYYSWKALIPRYKELWQELSDIQQFEQEKENVTDKFRFLQPHYCEAFSSYPSYFISENDSLIITPEGNGLLDGTHPLPLHYSIEEVREEYQISVQLLQILLRKKAKTIGQLFIELGGEYSHGLRMRSCMWLIKHGLAILEKSSRNNINI